MKGDPAAWSAHAAQPRSAAGPANGVVVPWLEGARPTMSSVWASRPLSLATYRLSDPPWEWPTKDTLAAPVCART
jgi:hypothetical protein